FPPHPAGRSLRETRPSAAAGAPCSEGRPLALPLPPPGGEGLSCVLMAERERVDIVKLVVQTAGAQVVLGIALFVPAGTLAWPAAWVFLGLMLGISVVESVWLIRFNPGLMNERMSGLGRKDQEPWDKTLITITAFVFVAWLVVMGLDA